MNSPHKGPVTRQTMFPFDDVIMSTRRQTTFRSFIIHIKPNFFMGGGDFCLTSCRRHYITGVLFRGCFGCSQVAITRCILIIQYNLVGDISLIDIWHIERKNSCKHWDHVITDVRYHSYIYIYIYIYALADLTVQMLTLLHNYLDRQSQYSNTWNSTFLALTAQVVRAFGMNSKVGGSSLPQVETFFVSKSSTLSQEHPFVTPKWMLVPAHS